MTKVKTLLRKGTMEGPPRADVQRMAVHVVLLALCSWRGHYFNPRHSQFCVRCNSFIP